MYGFAPSENRLSPVWVPYCSLLDEVNTAPKNPFQLSLHIDPVEEVPLGKGGQRNQNVYIAFRPEVFAKHGPEKGKPIDLPFPTEDSDGLVIYVELAEQVASSAEADGVPRHDSLEPSVRYSYWTSLELLGTTTVPHARSGLFKYSNARAHDLFFSFSSFPSSSWERAPTSYPVYAVAVTVAGWF